MPSFRGAPRWYRNRSWRADGPLLLLAGAGVLAVSVIGLGGGLQWRQAAIQPELRNAEHDAQLAGDVIAPLLTDAVVDGDPAALRRLDRAVRNHLLHEPTRRVKVWSPDGRIVYSDEHRLIGRRFELDAEDRALMKSGGAASELSDLSQP